MRQAVDQSVRSAIAFVAARAVAKPVALRAEATLMGSGQSSGFIAAAFLVAALLASCASSWLLKYLWKAR